MQTGGAIFAVIYVLFAIVLTMALIYVKEARRMDERWSVTRRKKN